MPRFDNPFALLGDEDDGADVAALVDRIAAVKAAEEQKNKETAAAAKPLPKSENVNASGRDGCGQRHGGVSGGRGSGYSQGRSDFRNAKPFYGYSSNQHQNGNTLGNGGGGYGQSHGDLRNAKPFYVYNGNQHQNGNTLGNGGGNGGRGYGRFGGKLKDGEGQQFGRRDGGRNGRNDRRNQLVANKQEQCVGNGKNSNNGHDVSGREMHMHETAEMTKNVEPAKVLTEKEKKYIEEEKRKWEQRRKDWEEEAKKLTLHQYEIEREKKRKELDEKIKKFKGERGLEGRVVASEHIEGKLLEKKEEEVFIKPKYEKEKLKRRSSIEKEDKVRKTIVPDFKFPKPERNTSNGNGKDQGQENRNGDDYGDGLSGRVPQPAPVQKPARVPKDLPIEDHSQFPVLGSAKS